MRKYGPYDCTLLLFRIYFESFLKDLLCDDFITDKTKMHAGELVKYIKKSNRFNLLQGPLDVRSKRNSSNMYSCWSYDIFDKKKGHTIGFK